MQTEVRNPFENKAVSKRYSQGRPYFHPKVVEKIHAKLSLSANVPVALDVGCGTGLSSKALLAIADKVYGVDASKAMLASAFQDPRINYFHASAEDLEFPDSTFDLITLSQILHWIDRAPFFQKATKVLKPGGSVAVYDNFFLWSAAETDEFNIWFKNNYVKRFPPPFRQRLELSERGELQPEGFEFAGYEEYQNPISLTLRELVFHLTTQSNIAAAVEAGDTIENATKWLEGELAPLFHGRQKVEFRFGGFIYYLRRKN